MTSPPLHNEVLSRNLNPLEPPLFPASPHAEIRTIIEFDFPPTAGLSSSSQDGSPPEMTDANRLGPAPLPEASLEDLTTKDLPPPIDDEALSDASSSSAPGDSLPIVPRASSSLQTDRPSPLESLTSSFSAPNFSTVELYDAPSSESGPFGSCMVYCPAGADDGNAPNEPNPIPDSIMARGRLRKKNSTSWALNGVRNLTRHRPNAAHFDYTNDHKPQTKVNDRTSNANQACSDGTVVARDFAEIFAPITARQSTSRTIPPKTTSIIDGPESAVRCRSTLLSQDATQKHANLKRRVADWKHEVREFYSKYPPNVKISDHDIWWMNNKIEEIKGSILPSTRSVEWCAGELSDAVKEVRKNNMGERFGLHMLQMDYRSRFASREAREMVKRFEGEVRKWEGDEELRAISRIRERIERMMMG